MFRTLLVEQNLEFRHAMREILRANFPSIEIQEAENADECLEKLETVAPDLVFTDIRLTGMDGLELTQRLVTNNSRIKVIVLSAYDLPEYRQAALEHGATAYFAKESKFVDQLLTLVGDLLCASERRACKSAHLG